MASKIIKLDVLEFSYPELESLPLFFKKISHNKMIHVSDEMKLMKHSSKIQTSRMRNGDPQRFICKTTIPEAANENDQL